MLASPNAGVGRLAYGADNIGVGRGPLAMKQLTGLDATFLYMETDATFGHVSSLSIYEKPRPDYDAFSEWRRQIERRLHLLEPLTRRLRNVPFNLDHPYWIQDPDFDLDFHVRHTAVPPPGGRAEVEALVARIIGRPLDRAHPLWESYVIEGLEPGVDADGNEVGRFGILTKVHHATVDGASGAELLTMMLDTTPDGDPIPERGIVATPVAEREPTDLEMLQAAAQGLARKPGRFLVLSSRTFRALGDATNNPVLSAAGRQLREGLRGPLGSVLNLGRSRPEERDASLHDLDHPLPSGAPRLSFNGEVSPHRVFSYRSVALEDIKAIKNALGATVNDVVMAICAGGLRRFLEARGELPDEELVAMVPVSIRTGEESEKWTNRVSSILANLPTNEPDAFERVRKVHEAMVAAKVLHDALPADELTQWADFPPPAVFSRASRLIMRSMGRGDIAAPINVTISNVPGPREPLYSAGAKLQHYIPVSTVVHGQGLNVTVQSYLDTLDFGLVACRQAVPDLDDLMDAIIDDFEALADAAGVRTSAAALARAAGKAAAKSTRKTGTKRSAAKKRATKKKAAAKKAGAKKSTSKKSAAKKSGS